MAGMELAPLLVIVASLAVTVLMVVGVFALVGRITARLISSLEPEGIVQRTGRQKIRVTLRGFRGAGRYASYKLSINYGELVLTERSFAVAAGTLLVRFDLGSLSSAEVWVEGGRLGFKSDRPSDASGTVEVRVALPDAEAWCARLVERGARLRAA